MPAYGHIAVAIPMMAEYENLPRLFACLEGQTFTHFTIYCCVNNEEGSPHLDENLRTLRWLQGYTTLPVVTIDRCSPGRGWQGKEKGVGWARKELFDRILRECPPDEVVVSLDADTTVDRRYFQAVVDTLNAHPEAAAFSVPYYHPLSGDEALDRPMLRYECYMRHYLISLLSIGNPYAFTALGSAMAFPLRAYRRAGGITPMASAEDFYLLQKFVKTGQLVRNFCPPYPAAELAVRPQGRASSRVPLGTGPAIVRGLDAIADSYPFYRPEAFEAVRVTFKTFPALYDNHLDTPMTSFLQRQLRTDDPWEPLRRNFRDRDRFVHACTERVDGLRILQYLHSNPDLRMPEETLPVNFRHDPIDMLDNYRNSLFEQEIALRY